VGDGVGQLKLFELLRGDPGLGLRSGVEGPTTPEATAVREAAEAHLREHPAVADADATAAASRPDASSSHRAVPPRNGDWETVRTRAMSIGNR
jgi:hypothetical protein